ncbi:kinase activity protein [[Candida] boidinii]|nr:kinase activity protein [[Candida] boidinii]
MFLFDKFRSQPSSYKRKKLYKFGEILGVGSFGSVRYGEIIRKDRFNDITSDFEDDDYEEDEEDECEYEGDEKSDNDLNNDNNNYDKVAIKIISKKLLEKNKDENNKESIIDEINLLKQLNNKNIVKFIDSFESKDSYYIITELATGGELFDRIVEKTVFTETDATNIIHQLLNGVNYLHNIGIIHRDLKPENILFKTKNDNSDIVIADFGIAKKIQNFNNDSSDDSDLQQQQQEQPYLIGYAGSFGYSAPETYTDEGYSYPADIWSVGVITYTLLAGLIPFRSETVVDFLDEVQAPNSGVIFYDKYWNHISNDAKDFILCALELNQDKRLTAKELLNHKWITSHIQCNKLQSNDNISVSDNCDLQLQSPLNSKSSLELLDQVDTVVEEPTEFEERISQVATKDTSESTLGKFQDDKAVSEYNLLANKSLRSNLRSMKKFKKIIRIVMMKNRFKKLRKELKSQGEEDTNDYGFDEDDDEDDDIDNINNKTGKVSLNDDDDEDEDDDDESTEESSEDSGGLESKKYGNYTYKKMYKRLRSGAAAVAATARRGSGCFDREKKTDSNLKEESTSSQLV